MYKHLGNDTYAKEGSPFNYKNYSTDAKGIAKGEKESRTQIMGGVTIVKKNHKIISTTPIEFKVNDKVILLETNYPYKIIEMERLISSTYAQVYGLMYDDSVLPIALSLE